MALHVGSLQGEVIGIVVVVGGGLVITALLYPRAAFDVLATLVRRVSEGRRTGARVPVGRLAGGCSLVLAGGVVAAYGAALLLSQFLGGRVVVAVLAVVILAGGCVGFFWGAALLERPVGPADEPRDG